jgi:hypothetical protein
MTLKGWLFVAATAVGTGLLVSAAEAAPVGSLNGLKLADDAASNASKVHYRYHRYGYYRQRYYGSYGYPYYRSYGSYGYPYYGYYRPYRYYRPYASIGFYIGPRYGYGW